jgi:molybdate transport system substrate-binding protein
MWPIALLAAVASLLFPGGADAAEITVLSSNAVKEAYTALIPEFEKATGHRVRLVWGGTVNLKRRVQNGEVADIVIIPGPEVEALIGSGTVVREGRFDLVKSIIGVAVRAGLPKPDVSSSEALDRTLRAAKSVVISSGPSSIYLLDLFERRGILAALRPKLKQLRPGESVGDALARGEGDLGFTQVSEFLHVKGIDYVGPLSPDVQRVTLFSAGLLKNAPEVAAARQLIEFLRDLRHAALLKASGLEPAY